jgi:hypothetical protein
MFEFIVLLSALVAVHLVFSLLRRRSEHRSGWKADIDDTPPRQARKKVS